MKQLWGHLPLIMLEGMAQDHHHLSGHKYPERPKKHCLLPFIANFHSVATTNPLH
jgi:hypothetical protein